MAKDPRYPFAVMSPPMYIDPTPVHGLTSANAGRTTEDPRRARCRQERLQGARHPRAPRRGARAGQRVRHRARDGLQREHGVPPAADARRSAATSSRTRAIAATCWGRAVYQLASAYLKGSDLATLARPHLEALRDVVGETVYLVILSQGEIVQLCKADGQHVVSASIRIGAARARLLHRDRQGAAVRPRARRARALSRRRSR